MLALVFGDLPAACCSPPTCSPACSPAARRAAAAPLALPPQHRHRGGRPRCSHARSPATSAAAPRRRCSTRSRRSASRAGSRTVRLAIDQSRAMSKRSSVGISRADCSASDSPARSAQSARTSCPRLGAVSFIRRFGSGLNRHAHLHACVTDGVFLPGPNGPSGPPAFLPTGPLTAADLAALTEQIRRRVICWFKRQGFLDKQAATAMLAWAHGGFSIDASVRTTILRLQLRVYCQPLEHLLRCRGGPPFAMERLSVIRGDDGRIACRLETRQGCLHRITRCVRTRRDSALTPEDRHSRRGSQAFRELLFGGRETGARGSGAAHQPGTCGGSAMGRAIFLAGAGRWPR